MSKKRDISVFMDHGLEKQIIKIQFNVLILYDVCDK